MALTASNSRGQILTWDNVVERFGNMTMDRLAELVGIAPTDVYKSEHKFWRWLRTDAASRAWRTAGTIGREPNFRTVDDAQQFTNSITDAICTSRLRVIIRRDKIGDRAEAMTRRGIIALPPKCRGGSWAYRGAVLVHEIAHHLDYASPRRQLLGDGYGHGPGFRDAHIGIYENLDMHEAADRLAASYDASGIFALGLTP